MINDLVSRCVLIRGLVAMACSSLPLQAQEPVGTVVEKSGPGSASSVPAPPVAAGTPASAAPANPASSAPQTEEEKRLQALLKLKFDRRPASVLRALASQMDSSAAANDAVQQFQLDVVAGRWPAVGEFLEQLPPPHASQVYQYLLQELNKAAPPTPQASGAPTGPPIEPALLPANVLEIAEAAPTDPTDEQIKLLGDLLVRALRTGTFIESFIAKLETGTPRFGGEDPKNRERAANLLIAANRIFEAGRFLPPLESAREKQDLKMLEVHARYQFEFGRQQNNRDALRQAWELTQSIVASASASFEQREQALQRSLQFLDLQAKELGASWLRENFQNNPQQGMAILAAVAGLVAKDAANRDVSVRRKHLEFQNRVVSALLAVAGPETGRWVSAVNVLAVNWLQAAEYSRQRHRPPRDNVMPYYDAYGNQIFPGNPQSTSEDSNQVAAIPVEQVLESAPGEAWLALLDQTLAPRVRRLVAELALKIEKETPALQQIEALTRDHPTIALDLAHQLLSVWATTHDPQEMNRARRQAVYSGGVSYGNPYGPQQQQGIPLTRAKQVRNIQDLATLVQQLRSLPLPPLQDSAVVRAFTAAHSQAEVFRVEDIETVFGGMAAVRPELLAELAQTMRERLARQWRDPRTQQQLQTKRTDKEIDAEVMRGYELVLGLIENGLRQHAQSWRLTLAQAAALFDWAEFQYGKKVDLAIYVDKRDRAFNAFQTAAQLYAQQLASLQGPAETPLVYQQWMNANLGASDLAYVTRQQEPSSDQLERIRAAINNLPGEAAERHLAAFAKYLSNSSATLRPELKPRYLRAGLRVAGEHPAAEEARKLVAHYDGLLQEIALDVRIDGDATVGHRQPFGVFVALRHTAAIERESGGFARYLRTQQNYYYGSGQPSLVNFREEFEKQVREKLSDAFEIKVVTFHDDKVQSRGIGRPQWRETPLAYLLLQAKDASVDRLPAFRMDLDFLDPRGQVVLPVESQVLVIDARPTETPTRPATELVVTQILDDRELSQRKLNVEIKATAKGLVPELASLLELHPAEFTVAKIEDPGVSLSKLSLEGDQVAAVSDRTWRVELTAGDKGALPRAFQFFKAKRDDLKLDYKRYADADLVAVEPNVALAGVALGPSRTWQWVTAGILLLSVLAAGVWKAVRRKPAAVEPSARYVLPQTITPFSVLSLLRRIHQDPQLPLPAQRRTELTETIAGLERHYFAHAGSNGASPNVEAIARHWVASARASA
ncbi:MAG: hypothetical protein M3463_11210 [Verrucomicrobiota bacterium]|nr:hypothetical protein [Verrucomicrobiota bacterium]